MTRAEIVDFGDVVLCQDEQLVGGGEIVNWSRAVELYLGCGWKGYGPQIESIWDREEGRVGEDLSEYRGGNFLVDGSFEMRWEVIDSCGLNVRRSHFGDEMR